MKPHVHLSAVHAVAALLFIVAVLGTLHMLALQHPSSPPARAWLALNF